MPRSVEDLFGAAPVDLPEGFRYQSELIDRNEERMLVDRIAQLPLQPFEFQGFTGNRRVVSFGWRYDFNGGKLQRTLDIPPFLEHLREAVGDFAGRPPSEFEQVLVTEYRPQAAIGWHRDRPVFGDVAGVSLAGACTFRFRRKAERGWERRSLVAAPRSVYLLSGASRKEWEHGIPAVAELRYSVTFRTLKARP